MPIDDKKKTNTVADSFIPMPRYQLREYALRKILVASECADKNILEIGYGSGQVFSLYQRLHLHVTGFDFSPQAAAYAQKHFSSLATILESETQIETAHYDFVCACEVLEHIKDDLAALVQWRSYLRPKTGKLIISVPAHQDQWEATDVWAGHYRRYEKNDLRRKLQTTGLHLEKIYNYNFPACLVLDKLRARHYERDLRIECNDQLQATKRSGIERDFSSLTKFFAHPYFWWPVAKLSTLFYHTDWGTGYILIAGLA